MARQTQQAQTTQKRSYPAIYVPEYTQKAIAGANFKTKKAGRPFIFDVRTFLTNTKDDGTVLMTYLLFGGVPSRKLHDLLEANNFKVRRRPRTWNSKDGKVVDIATRDNECYSVYYSTQPNISEDQLKVIAKLFRALNKMTEGSPSFLATSWDRIEELWGNREDWLSICAVDNSSSASAPPAAAPEEEDGEIENGSLLNDIDDLI